MYRAIASLACEVYTAGQVVPPGRYRDPDRGRQIILEIEGSLPASLDGRVAVYVSIEHVWRQQSNAASDHDEAVRIR